MDPGMRHVTIVADRNKFMVVRVRDGRKLGSRESYEAAEQLARYFNRQERSNRIGDGLAWVAENIWALAFLALVVIVIVWAVIDRF
jgi:hypothetical protein